jgi:hypothetical protein
MEMPAGVVRTPLHTRVWPALMRIGAGVWILANRGTLRGGKAAKPAAAWPSIAGCTWSPAQSRDGGEGALAGVPAGRGCNT